MIDSKYYGEFLRSHIPTARYASGGKEILCRCFYCPDSADMSSAHFYIEIPQNKNQLSRFYCHKCHTSGFVTHNTLIQWGIYEDSIASFLIDHNNVALKNSEKRKSSYSNYNRQVLYNPIEPTPYALYNDYINQDDLSASKLRYINNRLGTNLTYNDIINLKLVLNLNDIVARNNLKPTRDISIMNDIDQNFLGFISLDNSFINMRRLVREGVLYKTVDKRYINYSLYGKVDNTERFYTIPCNIDLSMPRIIPLHIAEGPFDILSIYLNLRNQADGIYTSIAGSNYKGIIRHFITTMRLPYLEIHLYPDNDKYGSNYVMNDIMNYVKPFNFPVYVHRNVYYKEKDFGVSRDRIDEKINRIL